MRALLIGTQLLFTVVRGRPRRVEVLNHARGTAEHYWSAFFAVDFAKAAFSNWVATDRALLAHGAVCLRCAWFTVIGVARSPTLSCRGNLGSCWAFGWVHSFGAHFHAGWSWQAIAYSTFRTTTALSRSGCTASLGKRLEFRQNGLFARGANDTYTRISSDEIEQGWDRLNIVPETQVETVIGVDLDHFDLAGARAR